MSGNFNHIYEMLKSPESELREEGLDEVGTLNPVNALEIISPFLNDPDPEVRGTAACNLGEINNEKCIPLLIRAAQEDPSEHVRSESLAALARAYHHTTIKDCFIGEVKREKKSRRPRQIIAANISKYNDESVIDALLVLLYDDDIFVRRDSARSLLELNRPRLIVTWKKILNDPEEHDYLKEIAQLALSQNIQ